MMLKQESTTTPTLPIATVCGHCGIEERRLLHHVRHRGIFRRLCTTCVLRLHPHSFCPTCFDHSPSQNDAVSLTCSKCYSTSHSTCVGPTPSSNSSYVCPLCKNPNLPIFNLKKVNDEGNGSFENKEKFRVIDKDGAKMLLAAAKIAAASTSKAAANAKAEAERRAKEAAFTRKRAREALEHVAFLVAKEKLKRKDYSDDKKTNIKMEVNHGVAGNEGIGNENKVLEALNGVVLKEEREKSEGFSAENGVVGGKEAPVAMDVEGLANHGNGNGNESYRSHRSNSQGERENGGVASVLLPVGNQVQQMEKSREESKIAPQKS